MNDHILVPVALDHEGLAQRKIELARTMLNEGGKITLLTVLENVSGFVQEFVTVKEENHVTKKVRDGLEAVAAGSPDIAVDIVTGKPGVEISRYAREHGVDLVIIGSHQPGAQDYLLGSTAARVSRRAPCSVFILR